MQVVKNIFISLFLVWFAFLLFMPKQELYYALEAELLNRVLRSMKSRSKRGYSLYLSKKLTFMLRVST